MPHIAENNQSKPLLRRTALAIFGELALRSADLDEILNEACRVVSETLETDLVMVLAAQADGQTMLIRAGVGCKTGVVGFATAPAANAKSEGATSSFGDDAISPDAPTGIDIDNPQFLMDEGVEAVAGGVIIGGRNMPPFGILQIASRKPRTFTDDDTMLLRAYANLIAAAADRLRIESELRDSEERLLVALDAGALGTWEIDKASRALTGSARTMQIFGYATPPESWNADLFLQNRVQPEHQAHVAETLRQAANSRSGWHFECRINRVDNGEPRWIEAHGIPGKARGTRAPAFIHGILADITARKATEEALNLTRAALEASVLERTRELSDANERLRAEATERARIEDALRQSQKMEAVGQLAGGLAHEFNNLFASISGSLEMILTRAVDGRTIAVERYATNALGAVRRAASLTQRLLAFSRRQTLNPTGVNVGSLVLSITELGRTVGPEIEIETRTAKNLWSAFCDPNQLNNSLLNLFINARDAMPSGGRIVIAVTNVVIVNPLTQIAQGHARDLPAGEYVAVSVADTGTGMSPAVVARACDPFFTTKPFGQGTGLGLSMVLGFAQQSGGHLNLTSEPGTGTEVTIYLPRYAENPEKVVDNPPPAAASRAQGVVVLVVDDEQDLRDIVGTALSDRGYTVLEAMDGRSALEILRSSAVIDLLLTDVGMPGGMNGRELADAARLLRPGLKVLFMTGYAGGIAVGNGEMEHGMQVITKPFTLAALVLAVRDMISRPA